MYDSLHCHSSMQSLTGAIVWRKEKTVGFAVWLQK